MKFDNLPATEVSCYPLQTWFDSQVNKHELAQSEHKIMAELSSNNEGEEELLQAARKGDLNAVSVSDLKVSKYHGDTMHGGFLRGINNLVKPRNLICGNMVLFGLRQDVLIVL